MAEKLKIIPLGGLNEIGKNMTAYEYGGEIIVVDCGMAFPGDDMYGIDCVIPDVTLSGEEPQPSAGSVHHPRPRGSHRRHPLCAQADQPAHLLHAIHRGAYQAEAAGARAGQAPPSSSPWRPGETVRAGKFQVEFIHVNHSIADSVAFAIHTRMGAIVHTGDFKIDSTPIDGEVIDLARFGELGKQGVLALLADSTNVERPGYTMSERAVGATFKRQFTGCQQRIIVTTFASNVHRIQQVHGRRRRLRPEGGRHRPEHGEHHEGLHGAGLHEGAQEHRWWTSTSIKGLPLNKQVIVTTGSQGEEMSALYRMAFSTHKQVDIGPGDKVIISASAIPGNEVTVGRVINELFRKGADVVYDKADMLHVSGHACQEELKIIHALTEAPVLHPPPRRAAHAADPHAGWPRAWAWSPTTSSWRTTAASSS